MTRVLSGIQPTGDFHLGNYVGALRQWVEAQHSHDAFYCVVDLHALTFGHDPTVLAAKTFESATVLLSAGIDPDVSTVFVQSHVPQHTQLSWVLECVATFGELGRMTQFKEKGAGRESVSVGLFTYPVLQAADILLYDADQVPVGEDQRQHLELARDVAIRFNHRFGETLVVPEAAIPPVGARVMDLQQPTAKMSKSSESPQGTITLLDDPKAIAKRIRSAVTDSETEVRYDPEAKPGVSNLLQILGAATGRSPAEAATGYEQYGPLKADTAEAVVEFLRPVQERFAELSQDPAHVQAVLRAGAAKAGSVAAATLARAQRAVGLLPPG